MLDQKPTTQFKRDVKLSQKRGYDISKLKAVMKKLVNEEPLDNKFKDHKLSGNYIGCRECHIQPDWLLIYHVSGGEITFTRTGTHSDLFKDK